MTTTKTIEMTEAQFIEAHRGSEAHDIPFGAMRVDAYQGEIIREAVSQYWQPNYWDQNSVHGRGKKKVARLHEVFADVIPEGMLAMYDREDKFAFPIKANLALSYPLNDVHAVEVTIKPSRFGEVFSVAHDLYKEIYRQDDSAWEEKGEDTAPRLGPKIMNRARGKLVWGHDMSDLFFEGLCFAPDPEWPVSITKNRMIIPEFAENGVAKPESIREKLKEIITVAEPLSRKHEGMSIGTITFAIGS